MTDVTLDEADVRILLQLVTYLDFVHGRDGTLRDVNWSNQVGDEERAAIQRLIDTVRL